MARLFDDAASDYLRIEQAVLSAAPFAVACWCNIDDDTANSQLLFMGDKDVTNDYFSLGARRAALNNTIYANSWQSGEGGIGGLAETSTSYTTNTWHHACGIWASSTDRRALIDGGSKGTNATDVTPINLDRTSIGIMDDSTPSTPASGHIAEMAIWDLSDWPGATGGDKADAFEIVLPSLADGFSPLCFPLGLVAYWPLIRTLNDKVGGYNLTASGTTVSAHPRIILPHNPL